MSPSSPTLTPESPSENRKEHGSMDIPSDYSKQREINIANNKLLLESLGLGGGSGILGESLSRKKKNTIK